MFGQSKTILVNISLNKDEHMYLTTEVNNRALEREKCNLFLFPFSLIFY